MKKYLFIFSMIIFLLPDVHSQEVSRTTVGSAIHIGIGNDFKPDNGTVYTNRSYGAVTFGGEVYAVNGIMKYSAVFFNTSEFLTTATAEPNHIFNQYAFMMGNTFGNNLKLHYQVGIGGVFGRKRGETIIPCEGSFNEYHRLRYKAVGFPVRAGFRWTSGPKFASGIDLIANFNPESTMWGVVISFEMGQQH